MQPVGLIVVTLLLVGTSCGPQVSEGDPGGETGQTAPKWTPTPSTGGLPPYANHFCTGEGIGPLEAEGQHPPEDYWRETHEMVGPVGLDIRQFATRPAADFDPIEGGHTAKAFAVIVEEGHSAILEIPPVHRDQISFLLDPSRHGSNGEYQLADGEPAVRLKACASEDTRFLEAAIIA